MLRTLVYSGNTRGPSPGCTGLVHRWCTGGSAPVRTGCAARSAHRCGTTTAVTCCTPAEQLVSSPCSHPCYSSRNSKGPSPECTGLLSRWCTGGSAPVRTGCAAGGAHSVRMHAEPPPQCPAAHLLNSPCCTWLFTLAIPRGIQGVPTHVDTQDIPS